MLRNRIEYLCFLCYTVSVWASESRIKRDQVIIRYKAANVAGNFLCDLCSVQTYCKGSKIRPTKRFAYNEQKWNILFHVKYRNNCL